MLFHCLFQIHPILIQTTILDFPLQWILLFGGTSFHSIGPQVFQLYVLASTHLFLGKGNFVDANMEFSDDDKAYWAKFWKFYLNKEANEYIKGNTKYREGMQILMIGLVNMDESDKDSKPPSEQNCL